MTAVPALNIIVSLLYISLAGATMFLLKLATKPLLILSKNPQKPKQSQESSKIYRRMIVSWLKKYSIIGSITLYDRKYLAKQLLITSVYGVACLQINKITLWPAALITFLLPVIFFLYQMAFKLHKNSKNETQSKNTNSVNIEIQCEILEGTKVVKNNQINQNKKQSKSIKNLFQLILLSILAFIGVVVDLQTVITLDKSISNSGFLNIISVFCIVLMDQFLIRPISGILFVAVFKILEYNSLIQLQQNKLVFFLCQQLLREELIQQQIRKAKALLQSTQTHLKSKQEENLRQTNVPIKPDRASMLFIDLDHIKPNEKDISSPHEALMHSKVLTDEEQIYLTTPQKQLFEIQIYENNQQTLMSSEQCNKENDENLHNSHSFYQQNGKKQIHYFEELVLTKDHDPLKSIQNNIEPSFKSQNQYSEQQKQKNKNKKKNNRRVLKLTGNSPYLQYLPNMLKNVRKAQTTSVAATVTTAPKLAELNFR